MIAAKRTEATSSTTKCMCVRVVFTIRMCMNFANATTRHECMHFSITFACVCVCVWTKSGNERNAHWNSILHQMLLCFIHEMFSLLHYIIASLIQMHILFVCIFFFSSLSLCRLQENIIRKSYFAPRTYIQHVFHRRCVVFSIRTATLISV